MKSRVSRTSSSIWSFKGSKRYPSAQLISETIEGVGGMLNASTDRETTIYTARIASRYFEQAMDMLADMVRQPLFARDEIGRERRVISEEIGMYMDDPGSWVSVLANEQFWQNTPLGREIAGSRETVQKMPEFAIREYPRAPLSAQQPRHQRRGRCRRRSRSSR